MRDLAGSCANIHAPRCRPLRDPTRTHGCQRFSTGVGTDPTSKAIGCPDLGNDHLIVMTNLRARQPGSMPSVVTEADWPGFIAGQTLFIDGSRTFQ